LQLSEAELEAIIDRAAKRGAKEALSNLGLHDEKAAADVRDMRDLISAWRNTRREAVRTVVKVITTGTLLFIGAAIWLNVKTRL
jgi:2-iminoacetate synthase ThiH